MNTSIKKDKLEVLPDTAADKIWKSIQDLKLEMFALPNQVVKMYCKPINIEPSKLYLTIKNQATSVLPALELALGDKYTVTQADRYIIVSLV